MTFFFLSQLETTGFYINRKEQALIIHKPSSQFYFYSNMSSHIWTWKWKLKVTSLLTESLGQINVQSKDINYCWWRPSSAWRTTALMVSSSWVSNNIQLVIKRERDSIYGNISTFQIDTNLKYPNCSLLQNSPSFLQIVGDTCQLSQSSKTT